MDKKFFPIFISLEEKKCLVIGSGKIGSRKVKTLLDQGAKVKIISSSISQENESEFLRLGVEIIKKDFSEQDLNCDSTFRDVFLVIAATSNLEINDKVVAYCEKKNILVNSITSKENMNTRFCAIIENNEYQIGVSGKGNPTKALEIKKRIEEGLKL